MSALCFCPTGATGDAPQLSKRVLKAITKERLAEAQSTGLKLCVDLSMTDSMSDKVGDDEQASNQYQYFSNSISFFDPKNGFHKRDINLSALTYSPSTVYVCLAQEVSRLAGQLRRLYGSNKKASQPFHVFLTDLKEDSRLYRECLRMNEGFLNYMVIYCYYWCLRPEFTRKYFSKERRSRASFSFLFFSFPFLKALKLSSRQVF